MRKHLLTLLFVMGVTGFTGNLFAQRFVSEIFSSVNVTSNITYGQNIQFLTGAADTVELKSDIYEPVGDTMGARPTVIVIHTGSFLPIFYNGQATGIKTDSAVTELCRQFARRGYTAIAVDYRLGWNPAAVGASGQDIRTGTLLQAVYRSLQDVKAAVRYFRNDANNANTYHIDKNLFILAGVGSGGYVAMAYANLNDPAQIALPKFLAATTNATYGFTAGQSYINQAIWGDFDGYAGTPGFNLDNNTPGVDNSVAFIVNMGGALGDSSWMQAAPSAPIVAFHVVNDPFAPYKDGSVIVPTTGDFVVDVSGSWRVIRIADSLGNNSAFQNNTWTDAYTTRANQINDGYDGLFPFEMADPPGPATGQAGPWEWYDSTTVYMTAMFGLGFTQGHCDTIWYNSLATNPDMSRTKALAYIDTIMGYLNHRIAVSLNLTTGIDNSAFIQSTLKVYPNPASDLIQIDASASRTPVRSINMYDISGRLVRSLDRLDDMKLIINTQNLDAGSYFLKIKFDSGEVIEKISIQ
ncbi:MAG: T9SS type A sorting domain-containing protein [Bacteroidetes bacterium]|nr:T9SS type A sorting domain-containing protein [Bacteroidota bacterium]MBK9544056.1 T9SS type A sorting domain-containing protein [Bacteroidota bacterium]MBL0256727.1 T9SS type A sorting domain-containing protein [Bacteroidota bacterium]